RTAPVFRSRFDAELTAKIYARAPVLIDEASGGGSNLWDLSFLAMFHMSNDSGLFRTAAELRQAGVVREGRSWTIPKGRTARQRALPLPQGRDERTLTLIGRGPSGFMDSFVPLYEAKMLHHFDHRWNTFDALDERSVSNAEKSMRDFEVTPRYWVP